MSDSGGGVSSDCVAIASIYDDDVASFGFPSDCSFDALASHRKSEGLFRCLSDVDNLLSITFWKKRTPPPELGSIG